jgi:hypothetical protein
MLSAVGTKEKSRFFGGIRVERHGPCSQKSVKTADPMQVERHERAASHFSPA